MTRQSDTDNNTTIEAHQLQEATDLLRRNQHLPMGIIGGLIGAVIGTLAWALVTISTNYQVGYMAIGVAYLVGTGVRTMGKGIDHIYGYIGATLSLSACLVGDFLCLIYYSCVDAGDTYLEMIAANYSIIPSLLWTDDLTTLLFYGIATYVGYNTSLLHIVAEEDD